jgi:hypothetical protein
MIYIDIYPKNAKWLYCMFHKMGWTSPKIDSRCLSIHGVELRIFLDGSLAAQLVGQLMARLKGLGLSLWLDLSDLGGSARPKYMHACTLIIFFL